MEDRETPRIHKHGETEMTRIMMATVCHVTSSSGLRKFQATWFLLNRRYLQGSLCFRKGIKEFFLLEFKFLSFHTSGPLPLLILFPDPVFPFLNAVTSQAFSFQWRTTSFYVTWQNVLPTIITICFITVTTHNIVLCHDPWNIFLFL